jgi:hypothetical protein
MSQLKTTKPFSWPAACYIVAGVGFGLMAPACWISPPAGRQAAPRLAADVAGGQAHLVAASTGRDLLDPAIASSLSGFEAALLLAGVILASAGLVGIRGLRHLQMPGSAQPR